MSPAERFRYKDAARQQLILWLNGRSVHNAVNGECLPDFSCCYPDLAWSQERRNEYARADHDAIRKE